MLLYEGAVNGLGEAFAARGLRPLLVKGQALVDMVYPPDVLRLAADIDLIVSSDEPAVAAVLTNLGYSESTPSGRPHSRWLLGERVFLHPLGRLPCVELHRFLDKIVLRPVDYAGILARARPASRPGFLYPAIEDLLLLVVLHADNADDLDAARVLADLHFLVTRGRPDLELVRQRARVWKMRRALAAWLKRLERWHGEPPGLEPAPANTTRALSPLPRGAAYFAKQLVRHDEPHRVAWAILRYGVLRALDRLG